MILGVVGVCAEPVGDRCEARDRKPGGVAKDRLSFVEGGGGYFWVPPGAAVNIAECWQLLLVGVTLIIVANILF